MVIFVYLGVVYAYCIWLYCITFYVCLKTLDYFHIPGDVPKLDKWKIKMMMMMRWCERHILWNDVAGFVFSTVHSDCSKCEGYLDSLELVCLVRLCLWPFTAFKML